MGIDNQKINLIKIFSKKEWIIILASFVFILSVLLFTFFAPNYYKQESPVVVTIGKGLSFDAIVDTLYSKKIITNKFNMKIAGMLYGAEKKIKAGRYSIPNGLSYLKLVSLLIDGNSHLQIPVTIPEGIWQPDLASIFNKNFGIDSSKFIALSSSRTFLLSLDIDQKNIEGYLLPETYFFYSNNSAEELLRKLKGEMDKFFDDKKMARLKQLGMTKHQILTLASIIDGESNLVSEFKTISGVYHNRLKKKMPLQADPTIQYLIRDKRKNRVLRKDLEIKSPYNTYLYPGLPPSPINNPGKDAINAALYPEKNNYLYFVADGNGGHVFATNYEEHSNNVTRYRRWRRSQN